MRPFSGVESPTAMDSDSMSWPLDTLPSICELVPHQHAMCFWQQILRLDENEILCQTQHHLMPSHPLKHNEHLSVTALIEYGAQAVAVHGGACAWFHAATTTTRPGYLAAVRGVTFYDFDVRTPYLQGLAQLISADESCKNYQFKLFDAQQQLICDGRVMVVHPGE